MKHRSEGQKNISVSLSEELLAQLDEARGGMSRSEFLRLAAVEKMDLDEKLAHAPDRTGKGGKVSTGKKR